MKLGLHFYITDPSLPQKDGVNLAHENITTLMTNLEHKGLEVIFHDFNELLQLSIDDARIKLQELDCIISNVGPHAHYYFWLREVCGLNFRIIRDVRTAIWSSYLLQEHLIAALIRPTDTLLVASNYTQAIYHKIFPHLKSAITIKCYPLTISFPSERPKKKKSSQNGVFTIGYIGRLSEDKNFPQLIDLIVSLNKYGLRHYRLMACGDVHSESCQPTYILNRLKLELGEGDFFVYESARSHDQIWRLFDKFDLMIFPSTSNLETFGRVLVEASFAKVPVICSDHAAAGELVPSQNLCSVAYKTELEFSTHFDHCLGFISTKEIEKRVLQSSIALSDCFEEYAGHGELLLNIIQCSDNKSLSKMVNKPTLSLNQQRLVNSICCNMPERLTKSIALLNIKKMLKWFIELQNPHLPSRRMVVEKLSRLSCYPDRSAKFSTKHMQTSGNFTNVGGIDIELCHVVCFYPYFRIEKL